MHALLARMRESKVRRRRDRGQRQALSRNRVDGIVFDVVSFTNLSHDHPRRLSGSRGVHSGQARAVRPRAGAARRRLARQRLGPARGRRRANPDHDHLGHARRRGRVAGRHRRRARRLHGVHPHRSRGPLADDAGAAHRLAHAANAALAIVMLVEAGFELEAIGHALADDGIIAYLPVARSASRASAVPRSTSISATARTRSSTPSPRSASSPRGARSWSSGRRRPGRVEAARDGPGRGGRLGHPRDHRPPSAVRGRRLDSRDAHPGRSTGRAPTRDSRGQPPERAIRAAVALAKREIRSSGPAPGTRITGTSRACAPRTLRATRRGPRCERRAGRDPDRALRPGANRRRTPAVRFGPRRGRGRQRADGLPAGRGGLHLLRASRRGDRRIPLRASAADNGAALVIAEREISLGIPVIVVPRGVDALAALAAEVVARVRSAASSRSSPSRAPTARRRPRTCFGPSSSARRRPSPPRARSTITSGRPSRCSAPTIPRAT